MLTNSLSKIWYVYEWVWSVDLIWIYTILKLGVIFLGHPVLSRKKCENVTLNSRIGFHAFNSFCPKGQNTKRERHVIISPGFLYVLSTNLIVKYWKTFKRNHEIVTYRMCLVLFMRRKVPRESRVTTIHFNWDML